MALMLQANPDLTPESIKQILSFFVAPVVLVEHLCHFVTILDVLYRRIIRETPGLPATPTCMEWTELRSLTGNGQ